jgi:hypothetical protein
MANKYSHMDEWTDEQVANFKEEGKDEIWCYEFSFRKEQARI